MDIIVNRCKRRTNLTEELVEEAVMREHREAMRACDVEDLVDECRQLAALLHHSWDCSLDFLYGDEAGDIDALYPIMVRTMKRAIQTLQKANRIALGFTNRGYAIKGSQELKDSVPALEKLATAIEAKWPVHDAKMATEALAAYGRGEYTTAEELLRGEKDHSSQPN